MRRVIVLAFVLLGFTLAASDWVVADPSNKLTHLGSTGGITQPIDIAGQYAYLGEGLGLTVLDISDPDQPVVVGRTHPFAILGKLVVSGDYVYAAADPFGELWVIDVSDPTEPALVTTDDSHWVRALSIDGPYLYAATFGEGLHIYDISDASVLQEVGYLQTTGFGSGVDAAGGVAYVAHLSGGLWIVDVSDPTNPNELARIEAPAGYAIEDVAVAGDYLYTEYYGAFRVIDVSDPANPVEVGTVAAGADVIALSEDLAFAVNDFGFVVSIDISNPADPQVLSTCRPEDQALDVAITSQYLYYTDTAAGVWVMDVTDPSTPVEVGKYDTMDWLTGVVASGDYAYVADQGEGLMVVDVSAPSYPQAVAFYNSPNQGGAQNLALYGNYVYLDAAFDGLRVLDISDPTSPDEVAALPAGGDVAFQNGYAYMVDGWDFYILDVSDPANPIEVAAHEVGLSMDSVQVSGDYAYVAAGIGGFGVLDISDPHTVTQVGLFSDSNHYMIDVALMGDYALVAVRDYYVLVLDVSDPAQIIQVGSYSTRPYGIALEGNLAYVPGLAEVEVIDVSVPANPILVNSIKFPYSYYFTDVHPVDGRVYVAGMNYGLLLYTTQPFSPGSEVIYLPVVVR